MAEILYGSDRKYEVVIEHAHLSITCYFLAKMPGTTKREILQTVEAGGGIVISKLFDNCLLC